MRANMFGEAIGSAVRTESIGNQPGASRISTERHEILKALFVGGRDSQWVIDALLDRSNMFVDQ